MKKYEITVDAIVSFTVEVDAESKEEAISAFEKKYRDDPFRTVRNFDSILDHRVVSIEEQDTHDCEI